MDRELITTSDGSHTLHVPGLNENYHSTHGALRESLHVFVRSGFDTLTDLQEINILEVGLGTGLNALLTAKAAEESGKKVGYTAVEAFPLPGDLTSQLNYPTLIGHPSAKKWFDALHTAPWEKMFAITGHFTFKKLHVTLQDADLPGNFFDLVYFDAFAPQKQPEMWTQQVFAKLFGAMSNGSRLVTYCAKGQVKRDLKSVGFEIENLPGPPGKREMIRAIRRKP